MDLAYIFIGKSVTGKKNRVSRANCNSHSLCWRRDCELIWAKGELKGIPQIANYTPDPLSTKIDAD